jgi:CBS domain-containing protein
MSMEPDITSSKQILSAFISKLPEAIIICDANGRILLHDRQSKTYLSPTKPSEARTFSMTGKKISTCIEKGLIEHALDEINEQLKQQSGGAGSTFTFSKHGRMLHAQVAPVLDPAGRYSGMVLIIDDITRQSRAQKRVDTLLRLLSQNARSPLASIRAAIEAMRSFPDMAPDRQEQFKDIIYDESLVLTQLLETAFQEQTGLNSAQKNIKPLALGDLLKAVQRRALERHSISCRIFEPSHDEQTAVMADPFRLISVFLFFLVQLRQQTGQSQFVLSCRIKGIIAFADICWDGPPIEPQTLKIWENEVLFSDDQGPGAVVSDILNQHHSTVWTYKDHEKMAGMAYLRCFIPATGEAVLPDYEPVHILPERSIQVSDLELFEQPEEPRELDNRLLTELSYTSLIREINQATQLEAVIGKHSQLPRLIHSMLTSGTKIRTVAWLVTAFSDAILQKLLAFALNDLGPPPVPFSFLVLGSEGRKEQTLKTDQDNAIVFQDPQKGQTIEYLQTYFLKLAEKVCTWLDQAGFDFCQGNIMAKNPKWCQPLSVWKQYFSSWVGEASPEHLLHASIFFDFRHAFGDEQITNTLSGHLESSLVDRPLFFRVMAENAIRFTPPLGFFSRLITESKGPHKNCLDIKKANQPIVDFAKIYSLKHKIRETATQDRLYRLYTGRVLTRDAYNDLEQAYSFNMQVRFMGQIQAIVGRNMKPDNYINLKDLSSIEKRMLKEVLKRIKQLKTKLEMDFIRD